MNDNESTAAAAESADATYGEVVYESGAKRSADAKHVRFDLVPPQSLERLARRYAMGAEKYGENNYLKGIPFSSVVNHMELHLSKWKRGDHSDDHLAAIAWGAFTLMIYQELGRDVDLDDMWYRQDAEDF